MGLLDAFKQYVNDAMPGGVLNAEWTPSNVRAAGELTSMEPGLLGSVASAGLTVDDLRRGNYGDAALNSLGLLPFVPSLAGATYSVKSLGSLGHQILKDGDAVGVVKQGKAKDAIDAYLSQQQALASAKQAKKEATQMNALKKIERQKEIEALSLVAKENADLLANIHKKQKLEFLPVPEGVLGVKGNPILHQSPNYGKKKGSRYELAMVEGKPAYVRESDHWGNFSTTDWINGEPVSTAYNWPLKGVETKPWGDARRSGFVFLDDLK